MKRIIMLMILLLSCTGCAAMDYFSLKRDFAKLDASVSPGHVDVSINSSTAKMAAYTIIITFDPAVVEVARVDRIEDGFDAKPSTGKIGRGKIRLTAFLVGGASGTGSVMVARIHFRSVAPGTSSISGAVKSLYDAHSRPLSGTLELSAESVTVEKPKPPE